MDHRLEGQEPIQEGFFTWAGDHPVTAENIKTFEDCKFGILCRKCNITIPTISRKEWFNHLKEYIYGI